MIVFKFILSIIYGLLVRFRLLLFRLGALKQSSVDAYVISIGNLTVGGTGKTPIVDAVVKMIEASDMKAGIVSRGYRGTYSGNQRVLLGTGAAKKFGDEPVTLKMLNPKVPVVVGRKRVDACRELLKANKVDRIVADDAYQHLYLKRQLNILLVDVTEKLENYKMAPLGKSREPMSEISRADVILLTKANLVFEDSEKQAVRSFIEEELKKINRRVPVIEVYFRNATYCDLNQLKSLDINSSELKTESLDQLSDKVGLASGLGNPVAFHLSLLKSHPDLDVEFNLDFPDHAEFNQMNRDLIEEHCKTRGVQTLIVTQKDAVKLLDWNPENLRVLVVNLEVEFERDVRNYFELH